MNSTLTYEEISKQFDGGEPNGSGSEREPVAQYTGDEFTALDLTEQTTQVMLAVIGSDQTGWIITTWDIYDNGETTNEGGTNQAGEEVYATRLDARLAAIKIAKRKGGMEL